MIIKVVLSLMLVIALVYGVLRIMQRWTKFGHKFGASDSEIKISSLLYIDENAKIISLTNKQKNYILGVTKNNIMLIDKYEKSE